MKQVQTFDLVRSIATVAIVVLHSLLNQWKGVAAVRYLPGQQLPPIDVIVIFWFITQAGFFFIISAAVQVISMNNSIQKKATQQGIKAFNLPNDDWNKIIRQYSLGGILMGILLLIVGAIFNVTFNGYFGVIVEFISGRYSPVPLVQGLFHNDATSLIGMNFIIGCSITWIIFRNHGWEKQIRNYFILGILAVGILVATPFIRFAAFEPLTTAYIEHQWFTAFFYSKLTEIWFPLFPYVAFNLIGSMIGIAIANGITKKQYLLTFGIAGGILFIIGLAGIQLLYGGMYVGMYEYPYNWGVPDLIYDIEMVRKSYIFRFLLNVNQIGFAFIGFFVLLWMLDYRSEELKLKRYKRNQWLYRVGKLSLTVFIVESAVRQLWGHVWTWLVPGWDEYLYVVAVFGLFNMVSWIIIAKLWEKVGYFGSVEWFLMKGIELATGKKSNKFESHSKTQPIEVEAVVINKK